MNGQTNNTSLTPNTPINTNKIEWTCARWFNKTSNTVANKTCRFLGLAVAASAAVFTLIPSLAVDLGYAIKRLYNRKINTPQTPIQNFMPSNDSEHVAISAPNTLAPTHLSQVNPNPASSGSTYHSVMSQSPTMSSDISLGASPMTDRTPLKSTETTRPGATKLSVSPETPRAIFIVGGSGSGKNTLADKIIQSNQVKNKREYVLIDADKEKEKIPEYKYLLSIGDPQAASKVHEQSLFMRNKLVIKSREDRSNIVYTGTGSDPLFYEEMFQYFKDAGYYVKVYFVDADESVCKERAKKRQEQNGRRVPNNIIEKSNGQARHHFTNEYKFSAHTSRHYTNVNSLELLNKSKNDWSNLRTIKKDHE